MFQPTTYLSTDVDMDDDEGWNAGDLRASLRRAERDHLVRARHDLEKRLPAALCALPAEVLEEGSMVAAPVDEGVGEPGVGEGLEEHRRGRVHRRRRASVGCAGVVAGHEYLDGDKMR